jgi:hypothetical protein
MNRLLTVVLALVTLYGCAQTNPNSSRRQQLLNSTPEERARQQTQQLKQTLALTADQETAVAAINLTYARQMQPLIDNGPRNQETMQQVRRIRAAKDQQLLRVLNEQQRKEYEAQNEERRDRIMEQRRNQN